MIHTSVWIKTTNDCNLKCHHCYNSLDHRSAMSVDRFVQSIDYVKKVVPALASTTIFLHGGEPRLNKQLFSPEIVKYVKSQGFCISCGTNLCYKLTADIIDMFRNMSVYDNVYHFETSWDYRIRFSTSQEMQWIDNISILRQSHVVPLVNISITNDLINRYTSGDEFWNTLSSMGVDHVHFERLAKYGNNAHGHLSPQNNTVSSWLLKMYKTKPSSIYCRLFEELEQSCNGVYKNTCSGCIKGVHKNITINTDGSIGSCPNYYDCLSFNHENLGCNSCRHYGQCPGYCVNLTDASNHCGGYPEVYEYIKQTR